MQLLISMADCFCPVCSSLGATDGLFRGPGDPFVHSVGHFWGLWDTRDYMRARTTVIDYLR